MEPSTEQTGVSTADGRGGGAEGIRTVVAAWNGGEPRGSSGVRAAGEAARRVGDLALGAAPVLPAHLTMAAGRKVAELKRAALVLVERGQRLVGVIDEGALWAAPDEDQLGDAMKRLDVCLTPATPLARAKELFARTGAAALPVAVGAFLLGVVQRDAVERALRGLERLDLQMARPASRRARAANETAAKPAHRRNAA